MLHVRRTDIQCGRTLCVMACTIPIFRPVSVPPKGRRRGAAIVMVGSGGSPLFGVHVYMSMANPTCYLHRLAIAGFCGGENAKHLSSTRSTNAQQANKQMITCVAIDSFPLPS